MGNVVFDGIMLADKAEGDTSFDVVRRVRRRLNIKKVGHAGTLDPFASGLLIILLGQGTKLSQYLMAGEKKYLATLRLGVETDTHDPTGRILKTHPVPPLDRETIDRTAQKFRGEIEQVPPQYSAVKHQGKRAYSLARKGIPMDLPKRNVMIHGIKVLSVNLPDVHMEVVCSKGTYVRSLAADIGSALGPGAHLSALRRVSSGPFEVVNAICMGKERVVPVSEFQKHMLSLRNALPNYPEAFINDSMALRIRNGYRPGNGDIRWSPELRIRKNPYIRLVSGEDLVAIAKIEQNPQQGHHGIKITRVFK